MENKEYLVTSAFLACFFSSLAMSSTTGYDKEVGVQNGFGLEGHHVSRKITMNLVYTPDLLHEADLIIGGGAVSTAKVESFADALSEKELQDHLYTRTIRKEDERMSYALQLLGESKLENNSTAKDVWTSLYRKAWLINPKNEDAAGFIGISRKNFGDFIDLVKEYQSRTSEG